MRLYFNRLAMLALLLSASLLAATQEQGEEWYEEIVATQTTQDSLSAAERKQIFRDAVNHKVASPAMLSKYDPTGEIGFCFGRAMAVHLLARQQGLAKESIRKLFVIGDLRSGEDPEWRFHVTTLVKGDDGKWYAIDPIMTAPTGPSDSMLAENWIQTVQSVWDRKKRATFYNVSSEAVMPDVREFPEPSKETGHYIIELKFTPNGKTGFSERHFGSRTYYLVSDTAETDYFMQVGERPADAFPFVALKINATVFPFRNYFFDLFMSFLN